MARNDILLRFQNDLHWPSRLLSGELMRFVFALLAACALLLSVLNGAAANAAVSFEASAVELLTHQEGDGDEVPDCPLATGSHHHHSSAGEHQVAATSDVAPLPTGSCSDGLIALARDALPPGLHPASEPHPPKA